jgi:flagellar basal-body rod protein FlgB
VEIVSNLGNELARYLDLNTRQIQLTATNMANIDTPGYRAVGLDFEMEMRQAIAEIEAAPTDNSEAPISAEGTTRAPHGSLGGRQPRAPKLGHAVGVHAVDGLIVRPDGNNVSMDRESLNLAAAQLRFKVGVALLKGEFSGIMSAIHADAK